MRELHYRKDIDGLRAVAVLSVILYHCSASWLPGGFAGVDIFFVISGFLITSIIGAEMEGKRFSLVAFYARRVRRILPPFFVMMAVTLLAGFFLLLPGDYEDLAHSARYATLFFSNHYFAAESDYFGPGAEEQPLLHTWSLAVEEQYYILWPLLLFLLLQKARSGLLWITAGIAAGSFAIGTVMVLNPEYAVRGYYWMPGRFGELLIGSMLACYLAQGRKISSRSATLAGIAGVLLLVGSFWLLDNQTPFPGIHALWPCLGAALLIYSGSAKSAPWANRWLSLAPVVWVGLLSYSLYLWHWPILAYARYRAADTELSIAVIAAALVLTLALSWLSWRFVETPVRRKKLGNREVFIRYFLLPALALLLVATVIRSTDGYFFREKEPELHTISGPAMSCHNRIKPPCRVGNANKKSRVLMFGDSHTAHLTSYMDALAQYKDIGVTVASAGSCPVWSSSGYGGMSEKKWQGYCADLAHFIRSEEKKAEVIVISMRWDVHFGFSAENSYRPDEDFTRLLERQLDEYQQQGKRIYLVAQLPKFTHPVLRLHHSGRSGENRLDQAYARANRMLAGVAAGRPGVTVVDFSPVVLAWNNGVYEGRPAYLDDHHLNRNGQQLLFTATRDRYDWLVIPESAQ